MADIDQEKLKEWYRTAMLDRIAELEGLRTALAQQRKAARAQARNVGHALLGSGATFGFPEVSEAGRLVEDAQLSNLVRRVEGLLSILRVVAYPDAPEIQQRWTWLAATAKVDVAVLAQADSPMAAWEAVAEAADTDEAGLNSAVARRFKLAEADLSETQSAATRLVPPALIRDRLVLPLRENGDEICVATCDPTNLELEFRLERITGRQVVFEVAGPRAILDVLSDMGQEDAEPRLSPSTGEKLQAQTVLVVDDSQMSRHMARAVLERKGYTVMEAEDGIHALETLEGGGAVGLIVVDLEMPRMGGREFVRTYRARPGGEGTPIVVLTGVEDPQLEADLIEDGADDYIRKPLDPRLFIARVTATLRRRGR